MAEVFTLADAVLQAGSREIYVKKLVELGAKDKDIVVMTADLMRNDCIEQFKQAYPDRAFSVGIAEANMVGISAGLALTGKKVFCSTMAPFLTMRACEQCRTDIDYNNLPVRLMGSRAGLSTGAGATHAGQEDIGIMRSLTNMTVVVPADTNQIAKAVEASLDWPGPMYIRSGKGNEPNIYKDYDYEFEIGKSITIREGKDATIIACGIMLYHANKAAELLVEEGYDVRVIDMHTIKPIDVEAIILAAEETGCIITAEDHNPNGGLGSAVAEVIAEHNLNTIFSRVAIPEYCCVGSAGELYEKYGMDYKGIMARVKEVLK